MPLEEVFCHAWIMKFRPKPVRVSEDAPLIIEEVKDDVMKELEAYVKNKKPQDNSGKEVYEMCDSML